MILVACVTLLVMVSTNGVQGDPSCPKKDGEYPVYIPHEDCTKFWQCSNGRPYLFDCPANLHFNPKLNVCDWPESAGCTDNSGGDDKSAEPTESSKSDETEDPRDSEEPADRKGSDETEDPKEPEEPEDSKDSDDTEDPKEPKDSEEPEEPKISDETEDPTEPVESEEPKTSDEDSDDPSCPKKDGEQPVYIPHEDCTKFWQCSNGRPYLFDCPANLHFNPKLNVCDWPENAGCANNSGGDDKSAEPTESSKSDETEDPKDSEEPVDPKGSNETEDPKEPEEPEDSKDSDDTEDSKEPKGSEEPKTSDEEPDGLSCPKKDGEQPVYIPHEDCTKFWQCSNGRPYLFDCPANLHFNPKLNVCDWPENAGCADNSGGDDKSAEPTESSKSDETEDPKDSEEPEDSKDSDDTEDSKEPKGSEEPKTSDEEPDDPSCPKKDGEYPVYIPHEDCTKFWQCSNGRPYLFDCPANLHFNPKLNVCDWPESAGCTDNSGDDDKSAEPTESSKSDETEDPKDSEEPADPKGSDETEDPKEPDNSKDSDDTESSKEPKTSDEDPDGPSCPKKDGEYPVYIPHEDCTKFWQCSNGRPYLFDCPANLHFNPKLNVCDWPENAGCKDNSEDTEETPEPGDSNEPEDPEQLEDPDTSNGSVESKEADTLNNV